MLERSQNEDVEAFVARIGKRVEDTINAQKNLKPSYVFRALYLDIKAWFGFGKRVKRFSLTPPFHVEFYD